jgi:uncharacterized protein (DUF4415 family)
MTANKKSTASAWVDPDDAPDLSSPEWQAKLAKAPVKRGRPKAAAVKISTTIRLDQEVLAALRQTGPGWQTKANSILREKLLAKKAVRRA